MRPLTEEKGVPREKEAAEQPQKCREREGTRAAASRRHQPGQQPEQQGEEQQLPNSPTRGGGGGAWVPVAAGGAVWTLVSRERREQEHERSGAERSPPSISSSIPPGVAGVWEVSVGASSGRPHTAWEKASSNRNSVKAQLDRVSDSG